MARTVKKNIKTLGGTTIMGECIGLDFGTTYSVVSHLNHLNGGTPEPIDFGDEETTRVSLETVVVVCAEDEDEEVRVGYDAINAMDEPSAQVYSGFKMLLNCNDESLLKERGYVTKTPREVTQLFMSELFQKAREAYPECRDIETVVVGVPYVWTEQGEDSRKHEVVDIVKQVTGASLVIFQSEPTLACAYFVDEINKKRPAPFEGYILVIDYGGGTLDVTLCKAQSTNGKSSIEVCESWGAGENKEGIIGSAGLFYMERVCDIILEENGIVIEDKSNTKYQIFKKDVETKIKSQTSILKKNFINKPTMYRSPDGSKYDNSIGVSVKYDGVDYPIKYSTLVRAYDESGSIKDILENVLGQAKEYMDNQGIPYNDYINGTFKIVTIGGFCRFALTEMQIRKDIDWLRSHDESGLDSRYNEMDATIRPVNRELAISFGAVLNANNIVEIKKQFPYTLCFFAETYAKDKNGKRIKQDGKDVIIPDETEEFVMFREKEEYVPGKPVFLEIRDVDANGNVITRPIPVGNSINIPYIQRKRKGKSSSAIKPPLQEMKLPRGIEDDLYIAMAMERNEKLTLYVYNSSIYETLTDDQKEDPLNEALIGKPLELENIDKLLGSFYTSDRRA